MTKKLSIVRHLTITLTITPLAFFSSCLFRYGFVQADTTGELQRILARTSALYGYEMCVWSTSEVMICSNFYLWMWPLPLQMRIIHGSFAFYNLFLNTTLVELNWAWWLQEATERYIQKELGTMAQGSNWNMHSVRGLELQFFRAAVEVLYSDVQWPGAQPRYVYAKPPACTEIKHKETQQQRQQKVDLRMLILRESCQQKYSNCDYPWK